MFEEFESLLINNKENKYEFNGKKLENVGYLRLEFDKGTWSLKFKQNNGKEWVTKEYLWDGKAASNDTAIKTKE